MVYRDSQAGYHQLLLCIVGIEYPRYIFKYSGTPLNGHPSTADTHNITDNSESPDCPSIDFNT